MSTLIQGTKFLYEIDTKDYRDGFIASGTESFVFKGKKISLDNEGKSDLSFSCVLKFKPKTQVRLERFKNQELKIFEELQECRSVARIYDVVEDIGDKFELKIPGRKKDVYIRNSNPDNRNDIIPCFCVIEEFIDGWSLEQYCKRKFWNLEKEIDGRIIPYHAFSDIDKEEILKNYKNEKVFLRYQDKLLHFMQSLCGILMFISSTARNKVLHLDIKPENIMVTRQSEELVLIDFGRSVFLKDNDRFVYHDMKKVDYNNKEKINSLFSHGTIGYAAPECFALPENSSFPFSAEGVTIGKMSVESDIFSFGATFWECMNIVELVTAKNELFDNNPHDFYEKNTLNNVAYFDRDLSLECSGPLGGRYHLSLQKIISKCTRKRTEGYLESSDYYHFYEELKNDLDEARDSIPTVKKGENKQIKNASVIVGACIGCIIALLLCSFIFKIVGYRIATDDWNDLINAINEQGTNSSVYLTTQFDKLSGIALERIQLGDDNQKNKVCSDCFDYLSRDGDISAMESNLIASLIKELNSDELKMDYIDMLMEKANPVELSSVSASVNSLGLDDGNDAYKIAIAIYSTENTSNYNYSEAYQLLKKYSNTEKYRNAVKHLAISMNNKGDKVIKNIVENTGEKRSEIVEFLYEIEKY